MSRIIDLGITYRKDEVFIPLKVNFIFESDISDQLTVIDGLPTSAIFSIDGGADQTFRLFSDNFNSFPIVLDASKKSDTLLVQYLFDQAVVEPEDRNQCLYIAGLIDNTNKVVVQDSFHIIARKTNKFVGAYEKEIKFDSVYIGNQFNITKTWYIRNVWTTNQRIFNDEYKLISSKITDDEIKLNRLDKDLILAPNRESVEWAINYSPLDTKIDEAIYKMYFYPFESEGNTQIIDSVQTRITGVGVEQEIKVDSVITGQFLTQNDGQYTIDLGELRPKERDTISIILENTGNFPIGYKAERFINNRDDSINQLENFSNSANLLPTLLDTITIEFVAGSGGDINFKYEFESDLLSRNIRGAQKKNSLFQINFIGTVKQPIIITNRDSIDFGTVTTSNDINCENTITEAVIIRNIGNEILELYNIIVDDTQNFSVSFSKTQIPESDTALVYITYSPENEGTHNTRLIITSNTSFPADTNYIDLVGRGIPKTKMDIEIDSAKSFPGTQIIVPILVEKEKIINANRYSDELRFNRTILEFDDLIFQNTASSSPSIDTRAELNDNGNLDIVLKRQSEANFLESDTLVLLRFNTFLGNDEYTNIEFLNTKIGNKNCEQIFEIMPDRGYYQTDSVCGIDYKTYSDIGPVAIQNISPNPINQLAVVNIITPVDIELDIQIVNMLGEVKYSIVNRKLYSGTNLVRMDLNNLTNGVYNILLSKDRIISGQIIMINK